MERTNAGALQYGFGQCITLTAKNGPKMNRGMIKSITSRMIEAMTKNVRNIIILLIAHMLVANVFAEQVIHSDYLLANHCSKYSMHCTNFDGTKCRAGYKA